MKHNPFNLFSLIAILALLVPVGGTPATAQSPQLARSGSLQATIRTADTVAPSAVANLLANTGASVGTVNPGWIAPDGDSTAGTASAYTVRYNTTVITDSNWSTSIDVTGEPTTSPAGSPQSMTVSGLTPGQRYYFAIKTQDEVPNTSGISNSPSAVAGSASGQCIRVTTVIPPRYDVFLPALFRNYDGSPPTPWNGSTIRQVTENTGGCLKFVGDMIHFAVDVGQTGGTATVDIGDSHKGIRLYDDGTHGDIAANDGVYELDYMATTSDVVRSAKIVGHFTSSTGGNAPSAQSEGMVTITDWTSGQSSVAPVTSTLTIPGGTSKYAQNRLLVNFAEGVSLQQVQSLLVQYDLTLASWLPKIGTFEVELAAGQDEGTIRQELVNLPGVAAVDRNWAMDWLASPVDIPDTRMPVGQSNYLNLIRAKLGWNTTKGSSSVKVAVIDTGIDIDHSDLKNQIAAYGYCLRCGGIQDEQNHGTLVAGIIAAEDGNGGISGVAPDAKLYVLKPATLDPYWTSIADAITKATDEGARVINLSIGSPPPPQIFAPFWNTGTLRGAIKYAYDKDVVLIAAAGYSSDCHCEQGMQIIKADYGWHNDVIYPASYTQVMAVGGTNQNDNVEYTSNYGDQVIFAPDLDILSTGSNGGYDTGSGNSFASPQVAALAALILSVKPSLHNWEVIDIIKQTADPGPGLGRINVQRALQKASTGSDPGFDALPGQPLGLVLSADQDANGVFVHLSWTPPITDYAGTHIYREERGTAQPKMVLLESGLIPGSTYDDHQVEMGRQYYYYIFSVDSRGQESVDYTWWGITTPAADVTMDQVYTTDYWGTLKSIFRPGEAIVLALTSTNHISQTIPVTYTWSTYDPSGALVSGLSWANWVTSISPGEDDWYLTRGIVPSALLGTYTYTASVSYAARMSARSTTFSVQGTPISINLLEALTCKNVQNNKPVNKTNTFTTADSMVYVWTAWEGMSGAHTARWEWYQPDGTLAYSSPYNFTASDALYYVWTWRSISTMSNALGQWSIKVYMDGSYRGTRYFTLVSGAQSYTGDQPEPFAPDNGAEGGWSSMSQPAFLPVGLRNGSTFPRRSSLPR